ncbi:acyl-CoA dehydrogenase family protein [Paraburkholderia tropica]|uniref:acyl-CoA dehydrogenase family protein n=1 Tax=Paraburkholderia tropica TaxID=92647 RepID=UPI002AAFEF55|nr:acyl-CoA dehydrogenase family protein [Paraburkholderia tropica]
MQALTIPPCRLDASCESLRAEVRDFLAEAMRDIPEQVRARNWSGSDPAFSRKLGERGWIGMRWPKRYGGHERDALARYVVLEELLAAGAPVNFHWVADRQSGPLLLRLASEATKLDILPRVARGELRFCIGMSEPDSGSDLASVRCRATQTADGWRVNGTKIWTSGARDADYMIALLRTDGAPGDRHTGLSQFLIDLRTPGIEIRPIRNLLGHEDFNEVHFADTALPRDALLGERGGGWNQVSAELALERSGPERFLSSIQLLLEMIDAADPANPRHTDYIGRAVADIATLRQMSLGIAGMLARGESPALLAAIVKDQGALFEQRIVQHAHDLFGERLQAPGTPLADVMAYLIQASPSFSLRGGTREILRGIIAKGLELR